MSKHIIISHGPVAGMHRLVLYRRGVLIHVAMAAHFQDAFNQLLRFVC
jgi:hypothetical protein